MNSSDPGIKSSAAESVARPSNDKGTLIISPSFNLSDLLISKLEPIRLELLKIEADKSYIRDVLSNGSYKAIEKSEKTIKEIKDIIGLG